MNATDIESTSNCDLDFEIYEISDDIDLIIDIKFDIDKKMAEEKNLLITINVKPKVKAKVDQTCTIEDQVETENYEYSVASECESNEDAGEYVVECDNLSLNGDVNDPCSDVEVSNVPSTGGMDESEDYVCEESPETPDASEGEEEVKDDVEEVKEEEVGDEEEVKVEGKKISKKLNWVPKASTPKYMMSGAKRLTAEDISKVSITTKGQAEKLAQKKSEAALNKVKNVKDELKNSVQEKKLAAAAARKSIVEAERARVNAAKKSRQEAMEKLKNDATERRRLEKLEKEKQAEEYENKKAELSKARLEAFNSRKK